jgi:hypothetical protein
MGLLKKVRAFVQPTPEGKIVILPILRGRKPHYGESVDWDIRVHKKGAVGPVEYTLENVLDVGGTEALYESGKKLVEHLRTVFPTVFKYEEFELAPIKEKEGEKKPSAAEEAVEILAK